MRRGFSTVMESLSLPRQPLIQTLKSNLQHGALANQSGRLQSRTSTSPTHDDRNDLNAVSDVLTGFREDEFACPAAHNTADPLPEDAYLQVDALRSGLLLYNGTAQVLQQPNTLSHQEASLNRGEAISFPPQQPPSSDLSSFFSSEPSPITKAGSHVHHLPNVDDRIDPSEFSQDSIENQAASQAALDGEQDQ